MVYLNGISSLCSTLPLVFLPTLITLLTGAIFCSYSPSLVSVTLPSSMVRVFVLVFSPSEPSVSTFVSPGAKLSSNSIMVSNGTGTFSTISWVPLLVPLPTLMIASSASTISSFGSPTISEFLMVHVVVFVPTLPAFTISYSPFLSVSTSLTVYLNGSSSTCFTSPSVFLPTLIIFLVGALVSVNSPGFVSVTSPFTIVKVVVLVFSPGTPSWLTTCSPGLRLSSNWISTSNGTSTFSSIVWVPLDLAPILIFLFTGALVCVVSPRTSSPVSPFVISLVTLVSCSPRTPAWSSTISFGSRLGSIVTSVSNGTGSLSTYSSVPVKSSSPTRITAFLASLIVLYSDSSVTLEFSIVKTLSFRPFSPVCGTPSTSAYFHSPFLRDGSFLTSVLNGMISVSLYWPLVFEPTLIFLVTGSLVTFDSPRISSPADPFFMSLFTGVCFSPSSPFWSTSITFGARLGSTVTSVSNGIGSLSTYSRVPSKSLSPTSIIAATGSVLSSVLSTTLEFSIVQVVVILPAWPFCSIPSTVL